MVTLYIYFKSADFLSAYWTFCICHRTYISMRIYLCTLHFFMNRGKGIVVGLLNRWFIAPHEITRFSNIEDRDTETVWSSNRTTARYGSVLILRRVGQEGLQVVWYDPYRHSPAVRQIHDTWKTRIFEYRAGVISALESWALEMGVNIHSRWWGGYTTADADDSVTMSTEFIVEPWYVDKVDIWAFPISRIRSHSSASDLQTRSEGGDKGHVTWRNTRIF